ncbi:MAG: penicillin acylase family protein, partial [Bryobacteraceae bacterium]
MSRHGIPRPLAATLWVIGLFLIAGVCRAQVPRPTAAEQPRWQRESAAVTITRDNWGIPHIHGKTNADAVFGMVYAQAEDDYSRIEMNYLTQLGLLAEKQGSSAIWSDLLYRMYINHAQLKQSYASSPGWLKQLMNAWADGLNDYLWTHPKVHSVIRHYEPWMALAFTEGSIGG